MTATIGASEIAVILGLQRCREDGEPYVSELELYGRLVGLIDRYDDTGGPDAEIGRWMEIAVGNRYAVEYGLAWGHGIVPGPTLGEPGLSHPDLPWLHVRPDFLVGGLHRTLEAKCPRSLDDRWGPTGTDEVPPEYAVQVLAQVAVAWRLWGVEIGDLAAMARAPGWGSDRVWAIYTLVRDAQREARVLDACARWIDVHVHGLVPPEPDGSESADRALVRMWAPVDRSVRTATPEDREHYRRLLGCRTAIDELQGRAAEARQRLQLAMGNATELRSPTGERLATWRPNRNGRRPFLIPRDTREEAA